MERGPLWWFFIIHHFNISKSIESTSFNKELFSQHCQTDKLSHIGHRKTGKQTHRQIDKYLNVLSISFAMTIKYHCYLYWWSLHEQISTTETRVRRTTMCQVWRCFVRTSGQHTVDWTVLWQLSYLSTERTLSKHVRGFNSEDFMSTH